QIGPPEFNDAREAARAGLGRVERLIGCADAATFVETLREASGTLVQLRPCARIDLAQRRFQLPVGGATAFASARSMVRPRPPESNDAAALIYLVDLEACILPVIRA